MISKIYVGVEAFFESFRVLKQNSAIRNLSFIPAFMSVVLFTVGMLVGVLYLDKILSFVIQHNVSDYHFLIKSLLYLLSFVFLALVAYLFVIIVVSILAIPVCTLIAEKTLRVSGWEPTNKKLTEVFLTALRMFKVSVQKFFIFLLVSLALFGASLLPVVAPLSLYLSFMIISFDSIDYALELNEYSFKQRLSFFGKHWLEMSGLSFCLMVLAIIPVVHILFLPIAVVAASLLYTRLK